MAGIFAMLLAFIVMVWKFQSKELNSSRQEKITKTKNIIIIGILILLQGYLDISTLERMEELWPQKLIKDIIFSNYFIYMIIPFLLCVLTIYKILSMMEAQYEELWMREKSKLWNYYAVSLSINFGLSFVQLLGTAIGYDWDPIILIYIPWAIYIIFTFQTIFQLFVFNRQIPFT